MKELTPSKLQFLREEINEALKALGEKHGVKFTPGKAKYSPTSANFELEVALVNADGSAETKMRTDFNNFAVGYGMKPEWLDKQFNRFDKVYQIIGLMPTSHKYPVLCKCLRTGKEFKLVASDVIRGMEGK